MKVPTSQQPYRPLVPVDEVNASDHCPPHNVRLKPLLKKTGKKEEEKETGVSGQNSSERTKEQQKQEGGVDVLDRMSVTAAVFHLERSALNLEALSNAVGGCRCRGGQNPKIKS